MLQAAGLSPFFFQKYPQFGGSLVVIDSNDFSTYHGLQLVVSRKFKNNVTFQGSYTFSKSLDTRSYDPTFTVVSRGGLQSASSTPFDPGNRKLNYARSDFDRTHILTGYAVWDLPFGSGQRFGANSPKALRHFIEGWQINGVVTIESGRPFTVFSGFNQFSNIVNSTADCNACPRDMGGLDKNAANFEGVPGFFNALDIARFSQPAPGSIGNTGRNYFTAPRFFNIDGAILKRTYFAEGKNLELRLEAFNVMNTPSFSFPTAVLNNLTFGRIRGSLTSSSRKLRIGAKLNF